MQEYVGDPVEAERAHSALLAAGDIPRGLLPPLIEVSWGRCLAHGLDAGHRQEIAVQAREVLDVERERNAELLRQAIPVMAMLHAQIANSDSMVILTDASGLILHAEGDPGFLDRASKVALSPGVEWSERSKGTNAIGTALVEGNPVIVHGPQHFLSANHFLTCSASPILDSRGQPAGVLDVTGDWRNGSRHSLALVSLSVQTIENQMFANAFPEGVVLRFHTHREMVGTAFEAMIGIDLEGNLLSANRSACRLLGMKLEELRRRSFAAVFNLPIKALFDHLLLHGAECLEMRLRNGVPVFGRPQPGCRSRTPVRIFSFDSPRGGQRPAGPTCDPAQGPASAHSALERLRTGDPQVEATVDKARKVLGRDVTILIQGETGTGKELLAKAIHVDGPRRGRPFVAVNCAAIPEGLIESELFGYEEGAFTGAKRRGYQGRILQANGGTLFLDEIGDMPLALQARLLRVLQERVVTPLGSVKSHPVDVAIICATHRKLRDLVARGQFRGDLYYRLNGLTVYLPSLRERTDLDILVTQLLQESARDGRAAKIDAEVAALFRRHPWPGNVRQLANLLRTASIMADGMCSIRREHLPDDFFDDLDEAVRPAQTTAAQCAPAEPPPADLDALTLQAVRAALKRHEGNVAAAARELGISRTTLYRKLKAG
jgi:transcriptional regulator of acetoin/glycerol metabolism